MRLVLAFNHKAEEFINPRSVMQDMALGIGPSPQKSTYLGLTRGCRPTKSHPLSLYAGSRPSILRVQIDSTCVCRV